jgi:hypothetical protein
VQLELEGVMPRMLPRFLSSFGFTSLFRRPAFSQPLTGAILSIQESRMLVSFPTIRASKRETGQVKEAKIKLLRNIQI